MQKRATEKASIHAPISRIAALATPQARWSPRQAISVAAVCLATAAMFTAGCSSDSSDGDSKFAEYEGTWKLSGDPARPNSALLTCGAQQFDFPLFPASIINMERGQGSDLFETAAISNCQFGYNVIPGMKALTLANPDPVTGMAPACELALGVTTQTDLMGAMIDVATFVLINPMPAAWKFNLQAPVMGKAPTAQLVADATVDIVDVDVTPTKPMPMQIGRTPCTYALRANLDKVSE